MRYHVDEPEKPQQSGNYLTSNGWAYYDFKNDYWSQAGEEIDPKWWDDEAIEEDEGYDDDDDYDDDYDSGLSHTQQCWQDRQDLANELLRDGKIDPEQADEIRHGA